MVGRWQFLWEGLFSGAMLVLGRVKNWVLHSCTVLLALLPSLTAIFFLCQKSPLKHVETVIWARLDLILQERNINRCICEVINGYILWIVLNRIDPNRWHSLGRNEQWLMLVNPSIRTQVWVWSQMTCRKAFSDKNLWILHWVAGQPVCFGIVCVRENLCVWRVQEKNMFLRTLFRTNASQYFLRHVLDHQNSCGTINRGSIFWIHGTMQWHLRRRYLDPPKKQLKNTEPRKGDLTSCSMVELESFFLGGGGGHPARGQLGKA